MNACSSKYSAAYNCDLKNRFNAINKGLKDGTINKFSVNGREYIRLPEDDADIVHLMGHLTDHCGLAEIGHAIDWRLFDRQQYDSICQWLETNKYTIAPNDISRWLETQNEYLDFLKGSHMAYIQTIDVFEYWPDSITDNRLREVLLTTSGDWKRHYNPTEVSWLSLPDSLCDTIKQLIEAYPDSRYLQYKLEYDSIENRYYELGGALNRR